jgi:drug/metabolite transporter (DMT)-like permease
MPALLFLGCCVVWSGSFLLMKKAVQGYSPSEVAVGRVLGGVLTLLLLCWWRRAMRPLSRREWGWVAVVALLGSAWPYTVQPLVVARQGSAFVALAVSLVPLLTVVISAVVLKTYPSRWQLVGVLGALLCLAGLLADGVRRAIPLSDFLWAATVPAGYAVANIVVRRQLRAVPPLWLTCLSLGLAALVLVPLSPLLSQWWPPVPPAEPPPPGQPTAALLVLGVLGTGLATWWFNTMVQLRGPLFAGMSTNLVPLGALLWGWADSEQVSPTQGAAVVGIVAMVALVQWGTVSPPAEPPKSAGPADENR